MPGSFNIMFTSALIVVFSMFIVVLVISAIISLMELNIIPALGFGVISYFLSSGIRTSLADLKQRATMSKRFSIHQRNLGIKELQEFVKHDITMMIGQNLQMSGIPFSVRDPEQPKKVSETAQERTIQEIYLPAHGIWIRSRWKQERLLSGNYYYVDISRYRSIKHESFRILTHMLDSILTPLEYPLR